MWNMSVNMALNFSALHSIFFVFLLFEILIYDIFVPQTHTQKRGDREKKNKTEVHTA